MEKKNGKKQLNGVIGLKCDWAIIKSNFLDKCDFCRHLES